VRDNRSESSHLEETIAGENQYEVPYPWSDNFNLEGTIAKENYSAGIVVVSSIFLSTSSICLDA
jgi:hypothetical protein